MCWLVEFSIFFFFIEKIFKGALLYEMLSGAPPFYSKDKTVMFRNRLEKPIEMK